MTTFFITAVIVLILSASTLYFSRHEPIRNGYQARVRTRMKGGKVVILEPKDDPRIVGDGWMSVPDKGGLNDLRRWKQIGGTLERPLPPSPSSPRTARIRDMPEPMGM